MESTISGLIAVLLIFLVGLTIYETSTNAQETLAITWQEVDHQLAQQSHTALTPITTTVTNGGSRVSMTLRNEGTTRIAEFEDWDLIVQYYAAGNNYMIDWYPYSEGGLSNNQWTTIGIYMDAEALESEVYEPDILNPGEEIVIQVRLVPPIAQSTTNYLIVSNELGVISSAMATR